MCVFRVLGEFLDVDSCVARSPLRPYEVYRRGERRFPKSKRNEECNEYSGLKILVSDKEWDDLPGQIDDAVAFFAANSEAIQSLVGFPNVEQSILDFPYNLRINGKTVFAQRDFLPPSLLKLAGDLGIWIELSLYPTGDSI